VRKKEKSAVELPFMDFGSGSERILNPFVMDRELPEIVHIEEDYSDFKGKKTYISVKGHTSDEALETYKKLRKELKKQ